MSDKHISNLVGSQNLFFAELLNDSNKTGAYINRDKWKEYK